MAVSIGTRPLTIDGCWASWQEKQDSNVVRTEMDAAGYTKVRRRTTGISRKANARRVLEAKHYDAFIDWFNVACQGGVLPTRMKTPQGKEEVWRFTEAPEINWIDPKAFEVSVKIEQLPAWRGL